MARERPLVDPLKSIQAALTTVQSVQTRKEDMSPYLPGLSSLLQQAKSDIQASPLWDNSHVMLADVAIALCDAMHGMLDELIGYRTELGHEAVPTEPTDATVHSPDEPSPSAE